MQILDRMLPLFGVSLEAYTSFKAHKLSVLLITHRSFAEVGDDNFSRCMR